MLAFPGDGDTSVCPTGALDWPIDSGAGPTVTEERCIGCGVCVQRCPAGAIQFTARGTAKVLDADTRTLRSARGDDAGKTRASFVAAVRERRVALGTDATMLSFYTRIAAAGRGVGPRFPNLLARNLLVTVGWNTAMRRAGDTNVRLDLLAQRDDLICVAEVEFSDAVIDAPRSVLDGLAVLRTRYGVKPEVSTGLVVASILPNQRSEYWHVMSDIETALGLRVHTITVGALVLLVWAGKALTHQPFGYLGSPSIRADVEKNLAEKPAISLGCAGALEAPK
jgi:Fe-S-cluster-containing hydrogenase component 2